MSGLLALAEPAFAYAQRQIRVLRSLHIGACFNEGAMVELAPGVAAQYILEVSHVEKLAPNGYSCLASADAREVRHSEIVCGLELQLSELRREREAKAKDTAEHTGTGLEALRPF